MYEEVTGPMREVCEAGEGDRTDRELLGLDPRMDVAIFIHVGLKRSSAAGLMKMLVCPGILATCAQTLRARILSTILAFFPDSEL